MSDIKSSDISERGAFPLRVQYFEDGDGRQAGGVSRGAGSEEVAVECKGRMKVTTKATVRVDEPAETIVVATCVTLASARWDTRTPSASVVQYTSEFESPHFIRRSKRARSSNLVLSASREVCCRLPVDDSGSTACSQKKSVVVGF